MSKHWVKGMEKRTIAKEIPGIALTAARYGMAERMARKVSTDKPVAGDLAGFIAADILDGVVLRTFNADTPLRRIADGVVDHLSMIRVGYEAAKKNPDARPYLGIIAARAALVGGANALHLAKIGEVTKGQSKQRAANLATAAFGLIAMTGNKKATHIAGIAAAGVNLITALPHMRNIGKIHKDGMRKL